MTMTTTTMTPTTTITEPALMLHDDDAKPENTGFGTSVALCTFNGQRFLQAQLESIAGQERLPLELVVFDDGSSDQSVAIVREFARSAPFPTHIVINDKNVGSSKNFERAILSCTGSIVALADQDDVWYPHKLVRIEEAFRRFPNSVAACSDADLIDEHSRALAKRLWASFLFGRAQQRQSKDGLILKLLLRRPLITGATMAFRREFVNRVLPIPRNVVHDFWISFLLAASGPFVLISEPLMQYRRHPGQQLGPGPLSVIDRFDRSRDTGAEFYFEEIERFSLLLQKIETGAPCFIYADEARNGIRKKLAHLSHRARLPQLRAARFPNILREAINGDYWRFSAGWKSVAKDLLLARGS